MALSHLIWGILNVFVHYLPDKKLRHSHIPSYRLDWHAVIIINHGMDLTYKFVSSFLLWKKSMGRFQAAVSSKPPLDSSNCFWILCIVFRLTPKHSEIFVVGLPALMPRSIAFCFQISGEVNYVMVLLSVPNWLQFCSTVDKTRNKQSACAKLIIKNGDNLPITPLLSFSLSLSLYISIYIYIYNNK